MPADQKQGLVSACVSAAQAQLDPLVTIPSGESRVSEQGSEWLVTTSVDHKTKWVDNWYDVTCVVQSPATVVSVNAVRRQS